MENDLSSEELNALHEQEATQSKEIIVVEMKTSFFKEILHAHWMCNDEMLKVGVDYYIKEVVLKDDFFKDDNKHKELKKESVKAYKRLKEYEHNARYK